MPWDDSSADPTWTALNAAIGSLIVGAAQLEDTIRAVLLNLIGGPDWRRTGLVIEGYTTSQIRERCKRLAYNVLGDDLQTDVLEWLKAAEQAQRTRNLIVHSDWASTVLVADGQVIHAGITRRVNRRARHGLEVTVRAYSPEEIQRAAAACAGAMIDGTSLIMELQEWSEAERQRGCADLSPWTRTPAAPTTAL